MNYKHCISTTWRSCKDVILQDGVLRYVLDLGPTYDLAEAYENDLHIRFANAATDDDLTRFVGAWGPLYIPNSQIPANGIVHLPLSRCRSLQRWLRAFIGLLDAFKRAEGEQAALEEFAQAEQQGAGSPDEPGALMLLRSNFHITGTMPDWVKGADLRTVRAATDFLIPLAPVHPLAMSLRLRRERNRRYVEAGWTFLSLEEALRWMIWYDEFTAHPIVCCQECRTVFRGDTAHKRKFCDKPCANRATVRNWLRKKRAKAASRTKSKRKQRTGGM